MVGAERRSGAVRVLDVLVGEVDPPAGARQEESPAVVSPAGAGRAWVALVLGEAVLGGLAQVRDVDRGLEQAAGGAGQPAESGAREEAAVVGAGRPAVAVQREQSMIALPPLVGVAAMAGMDRSSCFAVTYPWLVRVNLPVLSNELGADHPVHRALVDLRVGPGVCLRDLGGGGSPELALRLRDLRQVVAVGLDPALRAGAWRELRPAAPHSSPSGIGPVFCAPTEAWKPFDVTSGS